MTAPRSVLIYSMGEVIGDGLIKLPFIASLREAFPGASIHWCAAKGSTVYSTSLKPIVAGLIDEVIDSGVTGIDVSDILLLRKPFGGRRFDVVIDTQTNVRRHRPPISAFPTASRPPPGPRRWWIGCKRWRPWRRGGRWRRGPLR
jgi:hypothetical protein